jgi:hypothetical protein
MMMMMMLLLLMMIIITIIIIIIITIIIIIIIIRSLSGVRDYRTGFGLNLLLLYTQDETTSHTALSLIYTL